MKIRLASYGQGTHHIPAEIEPAELDLDPSIFRKAVHGKIKLDRHDPYFQFRFKLDTDIYLQCDRCLEEFSWSLHTESPMLYIIGQSQTDDVDDPDISYLPAGTYEIDLTTDLRDALLLAIPSKHLCIEQCRGLCSGCGANLNREECRCRNTQRL